MKHYMPTRILTGIGILQQNKDVFEKLGKRVLIITSAHAGKASGALDDLEALLKENGSSFNIFNSIKENPTVASCIEAGLKANAIKADYIIGVGGGSVLDAAKTAAVVATNPELNEDAIYALHWEKKPLPLILVGTTAGTGSEVT
ncbi:MAG: iron-containing alcohol dehydrogenase, partial [Erysipelotrichaceae bacterium]|nr:iron-containing alcohol dehydrogenase [Erysipelotrichaceae bacterium]